MMSSGPGRSPPTSKLIFPAGINHMAWPHFLFWNALGEISWATSVGLAVYRRRRRVSP